MFKSKEFRIGFIVLTAIILAYFGSLYLKNHGIVSSKSKYYSIHNTIEGISKNMQIVINGLVVGQIIDIKANDNKFSSFLITLDLDKKIQIPTKSTIILKSVFLKNNQLSLQLSNENTYLKEFDTIYIENDNNKDLMKNLLNNTDDISDSLKTMISNVTKIVDKNVKHNLNDIVANLSIVSLNLATISKTLVSSQILFTNSLKNIQTLTSSLSNQSENLSKLIKNTSEFSNLLSSNEMKKAILDFTKTSEQINNITKKIDNKEGSLGLIINDKKLYLDLDSSSKSLNSLLIDIKTNPKKYINVTIFGKKDKETKDKEIKD